jgi:hypothetical protein
MGPVIVKGSQVRLLSLFITTGIAAWTTTCDCQAAPVAQSSATVRDNILEAASVNSQQQSGEFSLNVDNALSAETPILDAATDSALLARNDSDATPILREAVGSSPSNLETRIDNLTLKILLKEIELERYSINYNMGVGKQGRWKGWRYGFFNEVNSGLGLAGGITSIVNRGNALHKPQKVRRRTQEGANIVPMVGNIIGAGAAGLELTINQWHEIEARKNGFSPKQARTKVAALKSDINNLIEEREGLVKVEASDRALVGRVEIDQVEGDILRDMRDEKLQQFERFHVSKRRLLAFQQMQYLFDIAKNVTGAIGYDQAYLSLHKRHRIYNGYAGVMFAVSGGLTMVGPVASRVFAKAVSEHHRRSLRSTTQLSEKTILDKLKTDHARLDALAKKSAPEKIEVVLHRSTVYTAGEKHFEDEIHRSESAQQRAKLVAGQNIGAGSYIGGSKIASGILFIIPGFNHRYNGKGYRADRATNDNLFAAAVVGLPATTFSMLDTLRINIRGEMDRQRQLKAGVHPSQLAKKRLKELDELEQTVKADFR